MYKYDKSDFFLLAIIGCVITFFEHKRFGTILMYSGTHLIVIALSLMFIKFPQKKIRFFEYVGDKLSNYIYVYHIAMGNIVTFLCRKYGMGRFEMILPFIIIIATVFCSQVLYSLAKCKKLK